MPTFNVTSASYIDLCGPADPLRLDPNRLIDIIDYLPAYLREQELNNLVQTLQDFLNSLYFEYSLSTSATDYEQQNRVTISTLEKINRLTEFHDADLCDVEYLQFFANYLGYSIDLNRGQLGLIQNQNSDDACAQEDVKRYMRFVIQSLPTWYKIKTTRNAVKIMLYSFGLIGDIADRFTSDYKFDTGKNWFAFKEGIDSYADVPKGFYPTPHFNLVINLDQSETVLMDDTTRAIVRNAVNSMRPATKVFDGYLGRIERDQNMYVSCSLMMCYYAKFTM
jgi:hypothetical protein